MIEASVIIASIITLRIEDTFGRRIPVGLTFYVFTLEDLWE